MQAAGHAARTSFWGDVVAGVDRFRPFVMGCYWPYLLQLHPLHEVAAGMVHFLVSHFPWLARSDHRAVCQRRPEQQYLDPPEQYCPFCVHVHPEHALTGLISHEPLTLHCFNSFRLRKLAVTHLLFLQQ